MRNRLIALLLTMLITLAWIPCTMSETLLDEGFYTAVIILEKELGKVNPFINEKGVFEQVQSDDFDTSKASLLAIFSIDEEAILICGKIDDYRCSVAMWSNIQKSKVAEAGKLFLQNYEIVQENSKGSVYAVVNGAGIEYAAKTVEEADSILAIYDRSFGSLASTTTASVVRSLSQQENEEAQSTTRSSDIYYVGNRNSKKFHYPNCNSVGQMKDSNKVIFIPEKKLLTRGINLVKTAIREITYC